MKFIQEWRKRRWRRQHEKYAQTMGVFWKPCPSCGEYFGGHEWGMMDVEVRHMVAHYGTEKSYEGVCPTCCENGVGITMGEVITEMMQEDLRPDSNELPGMWEQADLMGGLTDNELLG